jgi:hypothetical protein
MGLKVYVTTTEGMHTLAGLARLLQKGKVVDATQQATYVSLRVLTIALLSFLKSGPCFSSNNAANSIRLFVLMSKSLSWSTNLAALQHTKHSRDGS